jgi:hypothetical protein
MVNRLIQNRRLTSQLGIEYSASSSVQVSISEGTDIYRYNSLVTYNAGLDSRGTLATSGGASFRGVFSGWGDTINWWDVVSGATGNDDFVDYRFKLSNSQDWRFFQALNVTTVLAGEQSIKPYQYQVYIYDGNQGYTNLGMCQNGACFLDLSKVDDSRCVSIQHILIRVHIGFFANLSQQGAFQRVHLYSLTLV